MILCGYRLYEGKIQLFWIQKSFDVSHSFHPISIFSHLSSGTTQRFSIFSLWFGLKLENRPFLQQPFCLIIVGKTKVCPMIQIKIQIKVPFMSKTKNWKFETFGNTGMETGACWRGLVK